MSQFLFYVGVIALGMFVSDMARLAVNVAIRWYALKRYAKIQKEYDKKIEEKLTARFLEMMPPVNGLNKEQVN